MEHDIIGRASPANVDDVALGIAGQPRVVCAIVTIETDHAGATGGLLGGIVSCTQRPELLVVQAVNLDESRLRTEILDQLSNVQQIAKGNIGCHYADVVSDLVTRVPGQERKCADVVGKRELPKSLDERVEKSLHVSTAIGGTARPRQRAQEFD